MGPPVPQPVSIISGTQNFFQEFLWVFQAGVRVRAERPSNLFRLKKLKLVREPAVRRSTPHRAPCLPLQTGPWIMSHYQVLRRNLLVGLVCVQRVPVARDPRTYPHPLPSTSISSPFLLHQTVQLHRQIMVPSLVSLQRASCGKRAVS